MLAGIRVIEFADELAEYTGLLLGGLGAEVIKVEPPQGSPTRAFGPFFGDEPDPERSLFFWNYNRGKRSVVLDLDEQKGRTHMLRLLEGADVLIDSSNGRLGQALGLDPAALGARFPALVVARMTPFGDVGPWKDFKGSDLVHLALGGEMMVCGYDPDLNFKYDLPPIAPQAWHSYQIAGEQLAIGIAAALAYRQSSGEGQEVSCAVHDAVAKNTELDVMYWVMRRAPLWRLTCRHAIEKPNHLPTIVHTKDGRWQIAHSMGTADFVNLTRLLDKYGMEGEFEAPPPEAKISGRNVPGTVAEGRSKYLSAVQRFIGTFTYENLPWKQAQEEGLLWAPLRKPHENAVDPHWLKRNTYADVHHPEHGRSFRYPVSKWLSDETAWQVGRRAPLLGEDTEAVLAAPPRRPSVPAEPKPGATPLLSAAHGKPFPLQGVRILDFSWFLASAGGTRFLAALGAECLKVEWKDNPDTRLAAMAPVGGREAREKATSVLEGITDINMGGQFNNKNPGKRGISLNLRDPRGLQIAKDLLQVCDVVAEGFSPGVLDRLGFGYDVMKKIRPDVIYIQQSGMGAHGLYGRMRTVGPVAAAFTGLSEMSGLPEPALPAGWGYSYLDWVGAYSFALALLGAIYYRNRTGKGQWIDASQCESGLFLHGSTVLDWSANGNVWRRVGNRSPYRKAAPHGAYRCAGDDRWIAIACFTDEEWRALADVAGHREWLDDPRFAHLSARVRNHDALDAALQSWTVTQERYELMSKLQKAGVAAGVCQTAEDRCDNDPQLAALEWLTEVTGSKIGRWPVYGLPFQMSETPPYVGGPIDRGAPCYGEDNMWVLTELLGMTPSQVEALAEEGVI
ncbi:CoA transferase [Pseudochelatococcus sp. B33]